MVRLFCFWGNWSGCSMKEFWFHLNMPLPRCHEPGVGLARCSLPVVLGHFLFLAPDWLPVYPFLSILPITHFYISLYNSFSTCTALVVSKSRGDTVIPVEIAYIVGFHVNSMMWRHAMEWSGLHITDWLEEHSKLVLRSWTGVCKWLWYLKLVKLPDELIWPYFQWNVESQLFNSWIRY